MAEKPLKKELMPEILELSDADFALQMQGLVNEAKIAMEDRVAKGHAVAEEALAVEEVPEHTISAPMAVPFQPVRGTPSIPEMLRPLVQGVQAIGRVTGEHTQILARLDKTADEAAVAQRELPGIVADLKSMIEQRANVSRQMFDALYEELKTYKDGFLLDSLHRPMIRDLITLYDDLSQIHSQTEEVVEAAPGANPECGPLRTSFLARLQSLEAHVAHNLDFILEVLARFEVQQLPVGVGKLDKRTQRAVAVEIAEDPDQDLDLVRTVKRGFLWKDRVVRPEEVVVKKWKEGFLVALQTAPA